MKLIAQLTVILSLLTSPIFSQNLQWQAVYNGPADSIDLAQKILVDASGNVIVTGFSTGTGTYRDFATIKYNPSGVQQWAARYNGSSNGNDEAYSGALDNTGNIYICGNSSSGNSNNVCLVKYSSSGSILWNINIISASISSQNSMTADNSGNCFITGVKNNDMFVAKYSSGGALVWSNAVNGAANGYDEGKQILLDASGNIYAAGISEGIQTGKDIILTKFNPGGTLQWAARFNAIYNKDDDISSLKIDNLGNLLISGFSWNSNTLSQPVFLVCKFNNNGQILWFKTIASQYSFAMANDLVIDDFNNIYAAGSIVSSINRETMLIVKYNGSGIQQWINYYNRTDSSDDCAYRLAIDKHNYIYAQGVSKTNASYNFRVILKFNSNGNNIWAQVFQGSLNPPGSYNNSSLFTDNGFNIYSTGGNLGSPEAENYLTLKYTQPCYTVSGIITYKDNNQPVPGGYIKALYYDKSSASIIMLDSANIQTNGTYTLNCIHADSAYFMVYQDDEVLDFVPTYYPSTINWEQAQKIYVDHNLTNINIQVFRINNTASQYSISGMAVNNYQGTNYIKDAVIYAKMGNDFKNFAVSKADGSYMVKKLPAGIYTLVTYRMGYSSVTQNVTITNSSLSGININFTNPIGININKKIIPGEYLLLQNYPNPFNPSTKITFSVPKKEFVTLAVYDITGKETAVLVNNMVEAGYHEISFNASELSSGIYFYKLTAKNAQVTRKMVILK